MTFSVVFHYSELKNLVKKGKTNVEIHSIIVFTKNLNLIAIDTVCLLYFTVVPFANESLSSGHSVADPDSVKSRKI